MNLSDNFERHRMQKERIVVAMSGGVDSAAAALLLHEQGHEIIGISMQVWDYRKNGGNAKRATCCAPSDFDDARVVAEKLGFPFYVFDFEDSFRKEVIDPFVRSYEHGKTPNPCLDCNRKVKFKELRHRAKLLGAKSVATGHYAKIVEKPDGKLALMTSDDRKKDQTYFLYALTQAELRETLFPVGHLEKPEVRAILQKHGFSVASKEESQDICFVSGSVADFVGRERPLKSGNIRDLRGDVLGKHEGIQNFTVGQRKGLGLSNPSPLYVLQIDSNTNDVLVGEKGDLKRESFFVEDVNWIAGEAPAHKFTAWVKLRYRHAGVRCQIEQLDDGRCKFEFLDEWTAVSPGQAAVCYAQQEGADTEVLGGGIIAKDE